MSDVVVVTGAGSGIGRGVALELAARAIRPVLVGRRADAVESTAAECISAGAPECMTVPMDVTARGAADAVVSRTLDRFGRLDGLVNNAGLARFAPLDLADPEDWERMVATNLLAPAALIRAALGALRDARGSVVNVSSIGGRVATPGRCVYGATKAALTHLTRSLARELAPEVRVNAVLPGAVDTPMYDDLGMDDTAAAALRVRMVETTPLGRMGGPEDVAQWVATVLGPAGRWMTGTELVVDGGRSC